MNPIEIGIDSFAAAYDETSLAVSASDRLRNLVEQIEHADQVGLDSFGVGEHHRAEYLDSAPTVILGAAAARTNRKRLTSAVTVLLEAASRRTLRSPSRRLCSGRKRLQLPSVSVPCFGVALR